MINANTAFKTGSANNAILRYYLARRPVYFWVVFPILWAYILFKFHVIDEPTYVARRWAFLRHRPLSPMAWAGLSRHLPLRDRFRYAKDITVVDQIPQFLLDLLVKDSALTASGVNIDERGQAGTITPLADRFLPEDGAPALVSPDGYRMYLKKSPIKSRLRFFDVNREFGSYAKYQITQLFWHIRNLAFIFASAVVVAGMSLYIAYYEYNELYVEDILRVRPLILPNLLPVFAVMVLVYFITNRTSWAIGLGGMPFPILALVNFFMLKYRSFPLEYPDLFLAGEAGNMRKRYSYIPPRLYVRFLVLIVVIGVLAHFFLKSPRRGFLWRAVLSIATVVTMVLGVQRFYLNDTKFSQIAPISHGNVWDKTNRYATNGFIYSFLNTLNKGEVLPPKGYDAAKAKANLKQYKDHNIPDNKKINVITIQLEAFQDFSKWSQIKIDPSVYAGLHQVEKMASSGELSTTIFGGGTVDTERKVLTGYSVLPNLRQNTNAFPYYFRQQGYNTYFAHAGYAWFYNRQNIDRYLGFPENLFKENYYNAHVSPASVVPDSKVFDDLYKHFEAKTKNGKYLFNQTVTYQNHGPYNTTYEGQPLVEWQDGYNKADYAIINNYLTGVKQTSDALLALVNKFKNSDKPVVLSFWGDHNPWGGANNSTYKMLGINLDQGTQDGFRNFFNTPYVVYANDAAKKRLKTQFPAQAPTISPMYLLPNIFKHAGWQGNQYMQVLNKMEKTIPVFGLSKDLYRGQFVGEDTLPADVKKQIEQFKITQFYMQTVFKGTQRDLSR